MKKQKQKGAASIPLVLGIGVLVFLIAISITTVETARIYLTQANTDGAQATAYAEVGVRDALSQLARDENFGSSTLARYDIEMATSGCMTLRACVQVAVSQPAGTGTPQRIISALGYFRNARDGLQASVVFDSNHWGQLQISSLVETLSPVGL